MAFKDFLTSVGLAAKTPAPTKEPKKRVLPYEYKSVSRMRQDIKTWQLSLAMAQAGEPRNYALQLLFDDVLMDAHLTSQIENRKNQLLNVTASLKKPGGEIDEEQTELLMKSPIYRKLIDAILEKAYRGYSLVEFERKDGKLDLVNIPRTNVVPRTGKFYENYMDETKSIDYRNLREYGNWLLEFHDNDTDVGMLNKAVPHVLFKRFAQSCWSELCEIYGIPPRVMKTNTQDAGMLNRAQKMMQDMGAAAWFIIDETESFEWAKGADTNGDVYANLMNVCRNEISLLISGAVIGQDTKFGNRSKDESGQNILWELVKSDMIMVEQEWNDTVLPALVQIGFLKGEITFAFDATEDIQQLWKFTHEAMQYYKVDTAWLKETFGIEVTEERNNNPLADLKFGAGFFD